MARRGRKPRSAMLAGVMLLSETASGKIVSLSSVEAISSAPFGCKAAYNTPILGCSVGDFSTKSCSRLCLRNIDNIQATIQTMCGGTTASENSLLSQAQKGGLSSALCGTGSIPESSVTVTTSRSISAMLSSATPTFSSTTPTFSSATPTFSSTPSATRTVAPTLLPSSTTPNTSIVALPSSSRASLESTVNPPRPPQPSVGSETSTSSEAQRPTPPPGSGGGSGGGSPFDFITGASPASKNQLSVMGIVAGWALAALLVQ